MGSRTTTRSRRRPPRAGIQVFLTILGSPSWANGGHDFRWAPTGLQLQAFARAAATRYGGTYDDPTHTRRRLRSRASCYWGAWNEPNLSTFLRPQWTKVGRRWVSTAPSQYARICNQVYNGVHGAQTADALEKVACGLTSPRGNNIPSASSPSHTPLLFLRGHEARPAPSSTSTAISRTRSEKAPTWKPSHAAT